MKNTITKNLVWVLAAISFISVYAIIANYQYVPPGVNNYALAFLAFTGASVGFALNTIKFSVSITEASKKIHHGWNIGAAVMSYLMLGNVYTMELTNDMEASTFFVGCVAFIAYFAVKHHKAITNYNLVVSDRQKEAEAASQKVIVANNAAIEANYKRVTKDWSD